MIKDYIFAFSSFLFCFLVMSILVLFAPYGEHIRDGIFLMAAQSVPWYFIRGDVKIPSVSPQTFYKMLQNHLRGSVT